MKHPFIDTLPDVLKPSVPSMYTGESMTVLEYLSKVRAKMVECIEEFNQFATDIAKICEDFTNNQSERQDLFERVIEQRFSDFTNSIKLKFGSQDKLIEETLASLVSTMPDQIKEMVNILIDNGEFAEVVDKAIADLRKQFDTIVNNNNAFQSNVNTGLNNMMENINSFKTEIANEIENLENTLDDRFDNFEASITSADMMKSVYDVNDDGVVNDSERLGGYRAEYYAKKQEVDGLRGLLNALDLTVSTINTTLTTVKNTANSANSTATQAKQLAESNKTSLDNKLDKSGTAYNADRLDNKDSSYFATSNHSHTAEDVGAISKDNPVFDGDFEVTGKMTVRQLEAEKVIQAESLELHKDIPYIDFHFANNTGDYTSRIIEDSQGHLTVQADMNITGSFTNNSDKRIKNNIMPIDSSALFDKLKPVSYVINGQNKTSYGLIAQDVVMAMTELGIEEDELDLLHHNFWIDIDTKEEKEQYSIGYLNLIAMLIHEVQNLKKELNELKTLN